MPSIADVIFLALLTLFCFTPLSTRLLNDAGTGWHIRAGQQILATRHVPEVDSYSSIMSGKPWIAWEWLYDVIAGALDSALGLNGVVWLTAAIIAAVFAGTLQCMIRRGTNLFVALILLLLAIAASLIHTLARPHVMSWLFLLIWFWVLDSSERDALAGKRSSSRRLWWLPLSMIFWVNLHGGFLLGLILCVIFLAAAVWSWRAPARTFDDNLVRYALGRHMSDLAVVTLLSAAATFINPYGWRLHRHILSYLGNSFLMQHIEEFQSPNFHLIAQKFFLALLLLAFLALAFRKRPLRASELLVLLFAIYAGLYASRNIPIASILLVAVIGPMWPPLPQFADFFGNMTVVQAKLRGHLWSIAMLVFVFAVGLNGGQFLGKTLLNAHFDPQRMPAAAVDNLEKSGISQPVLTPDYWGGYLIYRLYPHNHVVIDDRHDLYGETVLASYLKMFRAQPGWDDFLTKYNVRCVMMPKNAAISAMLSQSLAWRTLYSDDLAVTFVKSDSPKSKNLPGPP